MYEQSRVMGDAPAFSLDGLCGVSSSDYLMDCTTGISYRMVSAENLEVDSSPKRCHGKGNGEVVFQEWRQRSEELSNPIPRGTRARTQQSNVII